MPDRYEAHTELRDAFLAGYYQAVKDFEAAFAAQKSKPAAGAHFRRWARRLLLLRDQLP
jgi:hypothetical protein